MAKQWKIIEINSDELERRDIILNSNDYSIVQYIDRTSLHKHLYYVLREFNELWSNFLTNRTVYAHNLKKDKIKVLRLI